MTNLETRDYFTDRDLLVDPYAWFEAARSHGPVYRFEPRDLLIVTGFEECLQVLNDTENYSAAMATAGPTAKLPFEPYGDDISDLIELHRAEIPMHQQVTSLDGAPHHNARALLNRLFVPSRLKANEEYMNEVAAGMADEIVARGGCDMIADIATPYVTLVIADLLGVPAEDREKFREAIDQAPPPFSLDDDGNSEAGNNGYMQMGAYFYGYVEDRRANPRDDILTQMSLATYPDGSTPDTIELVQILMFLFGAGQDTSAKLLGNAVRRIAEQADLQDRLRADPKLLPTFLEETMRLEGSIKLTSRLARRRTRIGPVDVPAGQQVVLALSAANRDPAKFDEPLEFRLGRARVMEQIGFGRGAHVCIGAPLARAEARVFLEKLLAKTQAIALSQARHGPPDARILDYEPSFLIRGLANLHVDLVSA